MAKTRAQISADWRANNPERHKELYTKYYHERKDELRAYQNNWRKENPDYFKTRKQIGYKNTPEGWAKYKATSIKTVAKQRGIHFDITWEDITPLIVEYCPVIGIKLNYGLLNGKTKMADDSPSVDRIDNTKGYERGNIVIISNLVNRVKTSLTLDQIQSILPQILNFYTIKLNERS